MLGDNAGTQLAPLDRFAAKLRAWRDARGMSQAKLASLVHVHRDLVAKIERGRRWPSHDLVLSFERTLSADGDLSRLWPEVESERARHLLLAAHERLTRRLDSHASVPDSREAASRPHAAHTEAASAFLGNGSVTVITPLKQEAVRARPVVALEDVVGAQRMGELSARLGLQTRFENVPIGGEIDLNRPNLVVICGPRLSGRAAAVLAQDPHLRFVQASDKVWTIHDSSTGLTHRSGLDESPLSSSDIAYFGRLPRLDGKGTILIFTGIHPQGSLGVVRFITSTIHDLYGELSGRCFSMLLGTQFHPDTGEPVHVERVSPVYWQKGAAA